MIDSNKEIWIFLSHSNKDFEKVRKIRNYLEEHSCRPLMFYLKCLSNDDEIDELIKREIDCRTRFIICDSENSKASKWVQSEVSYIKSQLRSYETLDLSKSEDEIKSQLDKLIKGTQIYLSYSCHDFELVNIVYSHISKYDIRCFYDIYDLSPGTNFAYEVTTAIKLASDYGFVVFFASRHSLSSDFTTSEMKLAVKHGAKILVLLLDNFAKTHYKDIFPTAQEIPIDDLIDRDNNSIKVRDLSGVESRDGIVELAIEKIVDRAFAPWTTYTMAKNLLEGIDCDKDEEEADRLFRIVYRKSDALDTIGYPGGTLFVARCLAKGYGINKDIEAALHFYQEYIGVCGSNEGIDEEIRTLKEELKNQNKI